MSIWTKAMIILAGLTALLFGLVRALKPQRAWEALAGSPPQSAQGKEGSGSPVRLTTVFWVFASLVALVAVGRFVWAYVESSRTERIQLLVSARAFGFLFAAMMAGMLASVLVASAKAQSETIRLQQLLVPLACSVLIFGSFWAGLTNRAAGPMELLAAFESGFCWDLFLNRSGQTAASSKASTAVSHGVVRRG